MLLMQSAVEGDSSAGQPMVWRIYPPLNYLLTVTVISTFHFDCDITVVAMCYIGFCRNEFGA